MCGFEVAVGGHHHSHGEQNGIGHLGDHQHLGGREVHTHNDVGQHFDLGHQVLGQSDKRVSVAGELVPDGLPYHQHREGRHQQGGSWDERRSERTVQTNIQSLLVEQHHLQGEGFDNDMGQIDIKGGHEHYEGNHHEDIVDGQKNEIPNHAVIGRGDRLDAKEDFFDYDLL